MYQVKPKRMIFRKLIIATILFFTFAGLALSCRNKKVPVTQPQQALAKATTRTQQNKPGPAITTDTLQFIHFEGNFDYWSCVFLNSKKDTIVLVTDTVIIGNYKNRLFRVSYFMDTLYQAGDNDSEYSAQRMSDFKLLKGKPFVKPITEQQVLRDVGNLPEVQSGADQVAIAERPTDEKNYYLVETGTHGEDNFSRFYMFRVYIYPNYEIRVYDAEKETDISLAQWRKQ